MQVADYPLSHPSDAPPTETQKLSERCLISESNMQSRARYGYEKHFARQSKNDQMIIGVRQMDKRCNLDVFSKDINLMVAL